MTIVSKLLLRCAYNKELLVQLIGRINMYCNKGEQLNFAVNIPWLMDIIKSWSYRMKDISCFLKYKDDWDDIELLVKHLKNLDKFGGLYQQLLLEEIDDYKYTNTECDEPVKIANFIIKNIFWDQIFKCDKQIYLKRGSMYENDVGEIKDEIQKVILNNDFFIFKTQTKDDKTTVLTHKISSLREIKDIQTMVFLNTPVRKTLKRDIDKASKGKLFFNNGYWDFDGNRFFNYGGDTLIQMSKNFNPKKNDDIRKQIYDRVLNPIFNNEHNRDWWLYITARMIAGCREDKCIYNIKGERDCGKGVLSQLLENGFEKYIYTLDLAAFAQKKNRGDAARENAFALQLRSARIALMNESASVPLDGNKLKQMFSGGDTISVRRLHCEAEEQKNQCGGMIFSNETPVITPVDTFEKIYELRLTTKFIDESIFPEEEKRTNVYYQPKDDSVKETFINDEDVINEFVLLIIEAYYKPVSIPECVLNERQDNPSDIETLKEAFRSDPNGFVTNKEIQQHCNSLAIKKNFKEVKEILKGIAGFDVKEHRRNTGRGLQGVSKIVN